MQQARCEITLRGARLSTREENTKPVPTRSVTGVSQLNHKTITVLVVLHYRHLQLMFSMQMIYRLLSVWGLLAPFAVHATPPAPGTELNASNVASYAEYLDETLVSLISAGEYAFTVIATEPFPPHPAYLQASARFRDDVALGDAPGVLLNYTAGRPFPEPPSADDPRAGDKIAWNMRYAYTGDSGKIEPFLWQYRAMKTGKIERELSFTAMGLRFKHRTHMEPVPDLPHNPADIFNALYLRVLAPPDIRDTQLLIHRLEDDTHQEQAWLYLSTQRRVRRLPTGQNTDAFLGSDIMIEDFMGYNGRLMDMTWRYLGTRDVLLPFYHHDAQTLSGQTASDGFRYITFGGTGNCYPQVQWQFRRAYIMEAIPKRRDHPLSKRLYYVDAETFAPAYGRLYDRNGKLWKFAIAAYSHWDHHLTQNKDSHVPVIDAVAMLDLQARHCTTLQFRMEINPTSPKVSDFAVQALRTKGR